MGDGAVRQGAFNETLNMAMLWKLPVIFVCENNGYAMGTSVGRTTNMVDIYKMGLGFDMPSAPVDGMDVVAVHNAMDEGSEEHTSELQSLMRTSYAVFCLKKKRAHRPAPRDNV